MQVINIHNRFINQSKSEVSKLFQTLATSEDEIWPNEIWPAMRFKDGIMIGSKGGHGRIRYTIIEYEAGHHIKFQFTKPDGFNGTHELLIRTVSESNTEIIHEIRMHTATLKATLFWVFMIRWLHDALIEDAFDKLENHFSSKQKYTKHNLWVTLLREAYKRKTYITKQA